MNQRIRQVGGALLAATVGLSSLVVMSGSADAAGQPARIKGMVVAPGGAPLAGIHVSTLKWDADLDLWSTADSDVTGVDGSYSVGKLTAGTYRVRYYDPSGRLATEFYNDKTRAADAEPIDVSKGNLVLDPAELGASAHLAGRVTDRDGAGIPGAKVTAYVQQVGEWIEFQSVDADPDGRYDLGGLPGGGYTLGFTDPVSGVTEYWNDRPTLVDASAIQVSSFGSSNGLDAQLATPATVVPTPTPASTQTPTTTPATPTTTAPAPTTTAPTPTTAARSVRVVTMPRIKGFAKVDQRLRVTKGAWNPTAVSRKVQWLANGKKIKGATKARLRLTAKLAGRKITVRVTATAPGMTAVTVRTAAGKKVKR
ncbi:carboxypeptidase regulatory-like domain-containing protein [Nocardioides sp. P5_C9_2]